MQQIYEQQLWGTNGTQFYSGEGSHHPELVHPYLEVITTFLKAFDEPLTVCDLGCGDFNIGKELVPHAKKFIAGDIVQNLVDFNTKQFVYPHLEFQCLDVAKDELPKGDCAILRQVLQHLSNTEILEVVKKLNAYDYVILTEHLPKGDFIPNKDIISGQGIRLKKHSGVDLLEAPFYLKVKESKTLLSQNAIAFKGQLVTVLYRMF